MPDWLSELIKQWGPVLGAALVALAISRVGVRTAKSDAEAAKIENQAKAEALITNTWKDERDQRRETQKEIKDLRTEFQAYKEKTIEENTRLQGQVKALEDAHIVDTRTLERVGRKLRVMSSQKSDLQTLYNQAVEDCAGKDQTIEDLRAQLKALTEAKSATIPGGNASGA